MPDTTVRFIRSYGAYNKGVEAGFPFTHARALEKAGYAQILASAPPVAEPKSEATKGRLTKG